MSKIDIDEGDDDDDVFYDTPNWIQLIRPLLSSPCPHFTTPKDKFLLLLVFLLPSFFISFNYGLFNHFSSSVSGINIDINPHPALGLDPTSCPCKYYNDMAIFPTVADPTTPL